MGILLGMGFLIFLAFAIPAFVLLCNAIVFLCVWLKTKKKGLWVVSLGCFLVMLPLAVGAALGGLLMIGPLDYGGFI